MHIILSHSFVLAENKIKKKKNLIVYRKLVLGVLRTKNMGEQWNFTKI